MWEGAAEAPADDSKHQSFICFEATSNQFLPQTLPGQSCGRGQATCQVCLDGGKRQSHRQISRQTDTHPKPALGQIWEVADLK